MRLIEAEGQGLLSLVEYEEKDVPGYAILSHTWGMDNEEEVTYKDFTEGTGGRKAGWQKIEFCREQAAIDNLQHFWIDTCCIDRANNAELSEAIISMFRWYQRAEKCYVYLSDVSIREHATNLFSSMTAMEKLLVESRWFRRGWTLQELIAPASVEFFSRDGDRLGTKGSLEQSIHNITGIAIGALRRQSLTEFTVEERFMWAEPRETRRQEDKAYALLGIFDVSMSQRYGEGKESAFRRLRAKIGKSSKCK